MGVAMMQFIFFIHNLRVRLFLKKGYGMNFILMAAMSLVPLFLGASSKMVFKTKL